MEDSDFEKLNDIEKINHYDSLIKKAGEQLDRASTPTGILMFDGYTEKEREQDAKRLERKVEGLRNDRQSLIERMKLGLTSSTARKISRKIFIAAWFDPSMDESIKAISEGITDAGFEPECIKDEHFSERIMDKALGEIRTSRCVVVDLTAQRPSVFFEAGFAFGLEIQTIYVYKKDSAAGTSALEFYVKHYKCYPYENPQDLRVLIKDVLLARLSS